MKARFRYVAALAVPACALQLAACGGGGGAALTGEAGVTEGAKQAPSLGASRAATGTVTYCQGKDNSGNVRAHIERFNAKFGGSGLTARLVEFPESADEQRNQFIQRQRAKSGECDVFSSDVIWTAEFARQKWLLDMSAYVERREAEFIPSTLEPIRYDGKYWGVPDTTDAAFLYYRTDKVSSVAPTWQAVYRQAQANGGIVYQGLGYEGLTCDFLELAFAAGGTVLSADGTKAAIDSPQNLAALRLMVDGIAGGAAPKAVTTYKEEESRRSFEAGRATYMRNWPYAYALGNAKGSKIRGKFKVAPLPSFEGAGRAGILGGHNFVISAYSKHPEAAVRFIDFMTSPEMSIDNAARYSLAPTLAATYDDPAVKRALPFAAELKQAVSQAKARPVSPVYPQISQAIYKNVNAALSGAVSAQDALRQAAAEIDTALATF